MEAILFSQNSAVQIAHTLKVFSERPAVLAIGSSFADSVQTKGDVMNQLIVNALRGFIGMFKSSKSEKWKGGRRSIENQNALDSILAALNSKEVHAAKLGRELARTLDLTHKMIKRGRKFRNKMEDSDNNNWIRSKTPVYPWAIKTGK